MFLINIVYKFDLENIVTNFNYNYNLKGDESLPILLPKNEKPYWIIRPMQKLLTNDILLS